MLLNDKKTISTKLLSVILLATLPFQVIAFPQNKDLEDANQKLNSYYKKIMHGLNSSDQIKLRTAQRTWIMFRDLDCKWAYKGVAYQCLIKRTNDRVKELQKTAFGNSNNNLNKTR